MRSLFIALIIIPISLLADSGIWQPLVSRQPQKLTTKLYTQGNVLNLEVQIPGFYKQWQPERQAYQLTVPGTGNIITPGSPRLPFISYLLALPAAATLPTATISYASTVVFGKMPVVINPTNSTADARIGPTGDDAGSLADNRYPLKQSDPVYFRLQSLGKLSGVEVVRLTIMPFRADNASQHLYVGESFTITLTLATGQWNAPLRLSSNLGEMKRHALLNWNDEQQHKGDEPPEEYLIIAPAHFVSALQPLVDWRTAEGFLVSCRTLQQVKKELQITELLCADKLREYISLYYHKSGNLSYVLLAGDVEFIPAKYQNDDGTDFYYSLVDGSGDLLPDVYLGRLPVNTAGEVAAIVNKIIAYEKNLPGKRALFGSYFQDSGLDGVSDRDYVYTSEQFRSFLVKRQYECCRVYIKTPNSKPTYYGDQTPVPPDITFRGTTQDIVNFINIGAAVVNHRDHGDHDGWVHPPFRSSDLDQLWNRRYPLLFNVDCATGKFDGETEKQRRETEGTPLATSSESFSEQILCLDKRGVVAVIAPTRITTNSLNNAFNQGLIGAIWPRMFGSCDGPASRLGQVLYRARIKLLREFGGNGWVSERILGNFRRYHILGDPALHLRLPQ